MYPSKKFLVAQYMHSFASYPPSPQGSFTLHPPYNPTDQNFFDTFVYSPNEADPYLSDPLPSDWAHYQPTYVQNFGVTDTEYPFLSTMHYPEPSMRYPELSMHHPEFNVHHPVLPLYSPCPLAAQFVPLLPDPSAAIPAQFVPLLPDPSAADNQALPYNPDQLTVCDLSAILNFSECYPEFFTNTEYCEEVYVPQPAVASDVIESFVGNAPSQVQQAPPHPSPHARTRTPPTVRGNAFVPSDSYVQIFSPFLRDH
jgi:hypothetical protein